MTLSNQEQPKSTQIPTSERITVLGVWREAVAIIRRYPLVTIFPAVVLGLMSEAIELLRYSALVEETLTTLTTAFVYYLYVAYVEEIVLEAEQGVDRIPVRAMLRELRQAVLVAPYMLVASFAAVLIPVSATELLVLPGLWLLTRWSLFAPALSRERLGPVAALDRSNDLARGNFWWVFRTATLAFILEEAVDHSGALLAEHVFGSETWGAWIGGSIGASLIIPLAAITTSVAYNRLVTHKQ